MIEQTVNSILEAEDEAKRRIAEAESKAAEVLNNGELAVEALRKQAAADNKAFVAEAQAAADNLAAEKAAEYLAKQNAAADAENKTYAVNVDKAVKTILESL
ncbi:MAG TPA: hypothetical protein DHU79_06530 [Clostridiales bacterium]|nr:hypothetical protein [Clostridiales bacterium]